MAEGSGPTNPVGIRPVVAVPQEGPQHHHQQPETPTAVGPNPNRYRYVYIHRVDQYFSRILARYLRRQQPGSAGAEQLAEDDGNNNNNNDDEDKASVYDTVVSSVAGTASGAAGTDATAFDDCWRIIGSIYDPCRASIDKSKQFLDEINANQSSSKVIKGGIAGKEGEKTQCQIDLADKASSPLVTLLRRTIPDIELIDAFNDADVRMALLKAEAIVYTIMDEDGNNKSELQMPHTHVKHNQNIRQAREALRHLTSRVDFFETRKSFVLVSTLLTWALTLPPDPDDPETPLTEEDYRRRVPHPDFTAHIRLEKDVLKFGQKHPHHLRAVVVASGVVYGYGENALHYYFKEAWNNGPTLKCVEPGRNILPLIHGKDLAHVVQVVLDNVKTVPKYLVACDEGSLKLRQLVRNISKALGTGQIEFVPSVIVQASPEVSSNALQQFTLNLPIRPYYLNEKVNLRWTSREGILTNGMKRVLREYRDERMLQPIRIIIAGLPQSGKTIVAREIAKKYKLHYVSVEDAVAEGIESIEQRAEKAKLDALRAENPETDEEQAETDDDDEVEAANQDEDEEEEDLEEQLELVQELRQPGGRLPEIAVSRLVHKKLTSKPCQNQGYVLDAYPQTYDQARLLFLGDNDTPIEAFEDSDEFINLDDLDERILPDHVFFLNADDEFLTHRVMNQRESALDAATKRMGLEERFVAALAEYRARTGSSSADHAAGAENVMQFYEDISTPTHIVDIALDPIIEDDGEPLFDRLPAISTPTTRPNGLAQATAVNQPKTTAGAANEKINVPPLPPPNSMGFAAMPFAGGGPGAPAFFVSSEKRYTAEEGMPSTLSEISSIIGKVRNYGPSKLEFDDDKRRQLMDVIEKSKTLSVLREENDKQNQTDQQYREIEWEKKARHVREELLKMQKRESRYIREYLSKKIMPSVTQALLACVDGCKDDDPIDFIAKYLIEKTYPDYSVKDEALDDKIKNSDL